MINKQNISILFFCLLAIVALANDFEPASDTFYIPETPPDIIITANTMTVRDGKAILEGNVKATRAGDILTCNRALVNSSPRWMLASLTPKLYRREAIPEQKVIREMNLEARNIFFDSDNGVFSASDSVHLRIEERSWDLATYTWTVITADDMLGFRDSKRMIFSGNVKVRDKDRYGHGNRLDYLKEKSLAILSGNAVLETQELNEKTGKMEPRIIKGQKITYDTETRQSVSE